MKLKYLVRQSSIAALLTASLSAHAQIQLSCEMDWSALSALDLAEPDRLISGIRAGDWTKEHIDQMLQAEEECARSSNAPETLREARWIGIQTQQYPNALRSLEARDQRIEREKAEILKTSNAAQSEGARTPAIPQAQSDVPKQHQLSPQPPLASADAVKDSDLASKRNLWIALAAVGCLAGLAIWQKFVRNRCPSCSSTSYSRIDETELDRWRGTKQVSERNSRGTNTRHVQSTFVQLQFTYRCNHCQNEWVKVRKEELGTFSKIERFFAGF